MPNQFPDVYITTPTLNKLKTYYKYATREISGLGSCYADTNSNLIVDDVILFDQESSSSETELNADVLAKWNYELIRDGGDPSEFRLWWHKHPITGWSTVDDKNIEGMNNGEWLLSIVKQSNGQLLARLDLYEPFRVTMDGLDILELRDEDETLDAQIKAEVASKVKQKVWVNPNSSYQGGTWVRNPDGGYMRVESEKKQLALPSTATSTSAQNTPVVTETSRLDDEFWEALADSDWEENYAWEERSKMYDRYHS